MKWEPICEDFVRPYLEGLDGYVRSSVTDRLLVPGGWLVRTVIRDEIRKGEFGIPVVCMVFVKDEGLGCCWLPPYQEPPPF